MKKQIDGVDTAVLGKRLRDGMDSESDKPEMKKICLEDPVRHEEDLSDISDDDADEILNRDYSVSKFVFIFQALFRHFLL